MTRSSGHGAPANLTQKLLRSHLVDGELVPGHDIRVDVDKILVEDATGTMAAQQLAGGGVLGDGGGRRPRDPAHPPGGHAASGPTGEVTTGYGEAPALVVGGSRRATSSSRVGPRLCEGRQPDS